MRESDEIKKGLECLGNHPYCAGERVMRCNECSIRTRYTDRFQVMRDALAYIQQLEGQNAEQAARLEQVTRERDAVRDSASSLAKIIETAYKQRDALMEELRGRCYVCTHAKQHDLFPNFTTCEHMSDCIAFLGNGKKWCEHWEWRGVPQEAENE